MGTVSSLALSGVALGTAALVVAMGLMSGYRSELAEKLAGTNAEVLVVPPPSLDLSDTRGALGKLAGVTAVARTGFAPGLLLSASSPGGADVVAKGLELPGGLLTTGLLARHRELAKRLVDPGPGHPVPALVGSGLARRLGLVAGATAVLETASLSMTRGISPPRRTPLSVVDVVETGFSEVDDGWAVVPLDTLERIAPPDARSGIWELKLARPSEADAVAAAVRALTGPAATVLSFRELNRDLFAALAIQQTLLFVVLALIVAVAAGTVVSSVTVLAAQKTREVGVLAALGAGPRLVMRTFRLAGLLVGGAGILAGTAFGLAVCWILTATRAIRFPEEISRVYYISWMPFRPEALHVLAIAGTGLLLVLVAALLPARRAARREPADALRYE